ncbi:MAG: YdeI/OmpD-associated family protein [Balneolaceae bacterium]|nr:YdeI/OmpD-associated family protein [Balneolaceae bacterium]MBO6546638.1 YdeI/OmpD-associated family protein [Balneolaceae bacterium]MBO6648996.1 YdeI/OmpD-associated family protein [Balneolaceae bacterium]
MLEWVFGAKRKDTRAKQIVETVEQAEQNIRAIHWR